MYCIVIIIINYLDPVKSTIKYRLRFIKKEYDISNVVRGFYIKNFYFLQR